MVLGQSKKRRLTKYYTKLRRYPNTFSGDSHMVNGKPNLTFTGAAPVSDARARQRAYIGGRNADNFASFLPAELGKNGGTAPGTQNAQVTPSPFAQSAVGMPARRFVPQQVAAETPAATNTPGQPQLSLSPTKSILQHSLPGIVSPAGPVGQHSAAAQPAAAVPASKQTRAEARVLNQPALQGISPQSGAAQPQRVAKSAPRISTPITGRSHIGMVDTRKTGGQENPNARPVFNPTNLAARSVNAQPDNSAFNRYAALVDNLTGMNSPQSFVSHGFSGTNAVLAMKGLGYDMSEAQSITTHARILEPDPYGLGNQPAPPAKNAAAKNNRKDAKARAVSRVNTAESLPTGIYPEHSLVPGFYSAANKGLGRLAAKFESGSEGIAAIGYDRKGGTSYGKYQIASRVGTMDAFISYLQDKAPDLAERLNAAGPANTGSKNGKMPAEWRAIAAAQPGRFEQLQGDFILTSHFEPAMRGIADSTGLAFEKMPAALQEVLFSTAVQHGPSGATRIISQAVQRVGAQKLQPSDGKKSAPTKKAEEQLITQIYNLRAGQFVSSTDQVQAAVRNRLRQEMREALQMLA